LSLSQVLTKGRLQIHGSSISGIILADFRFFLWDPYTKVDMDPTKRIEKSAQKNPEIDRTWFWRRPL